MIVDAFHLHWIDPNRIHPNPTVELVDGLVEKKLEDAAVFEMVDVQAKARKWMKIEKYCN